MKSELATRLDGAIGPVCDVLKAAGFRSRGRTFNRRLDNEMVQVVQVTMSRSDPPGTPEIPGFRQNMYGTFGVSLGVYLPEVAEHLHYWHPVKSFPGEVDCSIRRDLTELWPVGRTGVWPIDGPAKLFEDIAGYIEDYAFPFFGRHADRLAIVDELSSGGRSGGGAAPRIVSAVILAELGRDDDARRLLREQAELTDNRHGHHEYLQELSARLGL